MCKPKQAYLIVAASLLWQPMLHGQQDRIAGPINVREQVALRGNVNPRALPQYDQGPVDPAMKLSYVTLMFKPSPTQQAALEQLLNEQQDRTSPNYHKWLTPEHYADRFGLSPADLGQIRTWLESEGLTIDHVARSRNWVAFSGRAGQIAKTFHTEIHHYAVAGEIHFANWREPSIPTALQNVVFGFLGLDDLDRRAHQDNSSSKPALTLPNGHFLVPDDIATIYDIMPLYKKGLDGRGERLVVAGQSAVNPSDVATFRSKSLLPVNVPQIMLVPGSSDPGITPEEEEADLDIEWAGAVARNSTIIYVYSQDARISAYYAISENLASVVNFSFGGCELLQPQALLGAGRSLAQQGNAQGITSLAASGDAGAAACDKQEANPTAVGGIAVNWPASIPEVTAVGGTEFNEGGGDYWANANGQSGGSALSYIPEIAWNDSGDAGLASSGGGASRVFGKPTWQTGPGVLNDGARDVPDLALTASWDHDGYAIVTGGSPMFGVGGTSAATPVLAGIVALLNQYEGSNGQGNINPNLYRLAQVTTDVFHDITTGDNIVPCLVGTLDCTTGSFGYYAGPGYDPVTGLGSVDAYNLVTEWNATTKPSNVVPSCTPDPVYEGQTNAQGYSWFYTIALSETAGVATNLTGFTFNGADYSSQIASYFGTSTIPANGIISAPLEAKGLTVPTTVVFGFTGVDASGRQWSQQLSVPFYGPQSSTTTPTVSSVVNSASYQAGMSAGGLGTIFGQNLSSVSGVQFPGGVTSYNGVSVTVQGVAAPLFVVANVNGQEQINFQVPMEVSPSGAAQVSVNNNGAVGTLSGVRVGLVQPGIFEYVPNGSSLSYAAVVKPDGSAVGPSNPASRGTTVAIYLTGLGPTSPALSTGQPGPVPPALTKYGPVVAINGAKMPVEFSGAAPGFIGLDQVNFLIPDNAPVGSNLPLTVTVNGVASQTSRIAVR